METDRLKELMAICDAATEGPWENSPTTRAGRVWVRSKRMLGLYVEPIFNVTQHGAKSEDEKLQREHDAKFIATARTALPDALKALVKCREAFEKIIPMVDRNGKSAKLAREALSAIEQVGGGDDG